MDLTDEPWEVLKPMIPATPRAAPMAGGVHGAPIGSSHM
jgi:hypothetical protein